MGAFGQVTVNDAMVGKYTSEEWRSRAYAVRYFVGFTAAGASVGLVAWLYEQGGFATMLHAFAALCLLVIAAAIILPRRSGRRRPVRISRCADFDILQVRVSCGARRRRRQRPCRNERDHLSDDCRYARGRKLLLVGALE